MINIENVRRARDMAQSRYEKLCLKTYHTIEEKSNIDICKAYAQGMVDICNLLLNGKGMMAEEGVIKLEDEMKRILNNTR